MEKVKLTQEQAQMIENHRGSFERLMSKRYMKNCPTYIDELTIQQVVDAYFGGYEVEEKFEVGDLVVHENRKLIGEVIRIYEDVLKITRLGDSHIWNKKYTRHATPEEIAEEKQRRWWAKHDREVWELKEGDVIKGTFGQVREVCRVDEAGMNVTLPNYTAFSKEELSGWVVFCFAEDRKDMEGENE